MSPAPTVTIIVGDALAELRKLPDESVDCIVTSPPYWGLRCYGVEGQLGQERTLGEHLAAMVEVFRECRRVLKAGGTCWINYGDCYASTPNGRSAADTKALSDDDRTFRDKPFSTVGPIEPPESTTFGRGVLKPKDLCMVPQRLFIALQEDGWWVRSVLPWVKRNGMPESISDRPANSVEYVALLTKSARYFYDAEAVRRTASANTHARTSQKMPDGWDTGPGGYGSFHRLGREKGKTSKQDATAASIPDAARARRIHGFNARWDASEKRRLKIPPAGSGVRANETNLDVLRGAVLHDRNFRNTDLFFDSLEAPWGLISDGDGAPLALDVPPQAFREAHFATFPPALVSPLIRAGCPAGGTVLDPFGGAGTTGLVAQRLLRDAILIELNPDYAAMARDRIRAQLGAVACDLPEKTPSGGLFDLPGFITVEAEAAEAAE